MTGRQCLAIGCHRDDLVGTPPQISSLVGIGQRRSREEITAVIRKGAGRMAGFPQLEADAVVAIVSYLVEGDASAPAAPGAARPVLRYRFTGYRKFLDPDGYPAVAPPWGTLNAINLNTGESVWQIPFGEYPELAAKGLKEYRQRELRGSGRHGRRPRFHRRHQF